MAYGDVRYTLVSNGSTATSAASAHNLYGVYGGLSQLNANEVLQIMVSASGTDVRLSLDPTTGATNDLGLRVFAAASVFDLPTMSVADASQITFAREAAQNPTMFWTIMRRVP